MAGFLPIERMRARVAQDRTDSDVSLFYSLLYYGELLTKLLALGLAAGVKEDRDRRRYSVLYQMVRADGLGAWCSAIDECLSGPASQHLLEQLRDTQRQLTQRVARDHSSYRSVEVLKGVLDRLDIASDPLSDRAALRQWFPLFATLRNKTRGHGAPKGQQCSECCAALEQSIEHFAANLVLFARPWAHLHRNLSGKYRVTPLGGDCSKFNDLKRRTDVNLPNGIYVDLDELRLVELLESDVDATDFFVPNGGFDSESFELLSFLSNERRRAPAALYLLPATALPESETQGHGRLDVVGSCFTNLPPMPRGYIARPDLEHSLVEQLRLDRHPIITLTGPGGIGKTSLALKVLHELCSGPTSPYEVVVWLSARDIDLMPSGPKAVRPHVLTQRDFAVEFARLLEPAGFGSKTFDPVTYLAESLQKGPTGTVLFVLDNFETVASPAEMFRWIDTYVRLPNKILITTRIRDFAGDYPVEVTGMSEHEATILIDSVASDLGIRSLVSTDYRDELIRESDGHPYVIKILLGEVAKERRAGKPERIVASQEDILTALFERSFAALTPAAQRIFLLLSSWRSVVPEVALEAVLLRSENERTDVRRGLDELRKMSLIEEIESEADSELFVGVPLAAALFGRRKLTASPLRVVVDADAQLLKAFGAGRKEDVRHGVLPRVQRLLRKLASEQDAADGHTEPSDVAPMLEFLASRVPVIWVELAAFYEETGGPQGREQAKAALRRYLEKPGEATEISRVWKRLAELCQQTQDYTGEIHALAEMCDVPEVPTDVISSAANRLNSLFVHFNRTGSNPIDRDERGLIVRRIASRMEARIEELDATDCSRLAWLFVNLKEVGRGVEVVKRGLELDPSSNHCQSLADRLRRSGSA